MFLDILLDYRLVVLLVADFFRSCFTGRGVIRFNSGFTEEMLSTASPSVV